MPFPCSKRARPSARDGPGLLETISPERAVGKQIAVLTRSRAFASALVLVLVLVLDFSHGPALDGEDEDEDRSLRSLRTRTISLRHAFSSPPADQRRSPAKGEPVPMRT